MLSGGLSSRASKAWVPAPEEGCSSALTVLGASTLPAHHTQGSPAPRWHPGVAGTPGRSPCVVGLCPLWGGWTTRVFQVTPGTVGASSTGTHWRGSSWPAGGSAATTWGPAVDVTRVPPPQGSWPLAR